MPSRALDNPDDLLHTRTATSGSSEDDLTPAPQPSRPLQTRDRERYEIEGEHARGGLGRVLRVRDRDLERTLAVKELLHTSRRAEARFVREARITARLQHPGIVPIHEAGRWPDGSPFYSMKFVSGRTLKQAIAVCESFEDRLGLLQSVIAIANAVAYAHSEGIVHRDLKPANVMLGEFGETVVVDWGLAKEISGSDPGEAAGPFRIPADTDITGEGSVVGTPGYMPPEQARGEDVDARADVYSIGAILYHVLAGRGAYANTDPKVVLARLLDDAPEPVSSVEPRVPSDLAAIVDKAMARDRAQRYPTAAELAVDLERFARGQLVGVHAYSRTELLLRWLRRHKTSVAVATVALAAVAVIGVVSIQRIVRASVLAENRANEMTLMQARTLLDTDPTESLAVLKTYPDSGNDWTTARDIAADAVSRGVAKHVVHGHRGRVTGLAFTGDGEELVSSGWDGTVRRWREDGTPVGDAARTDVNGAVVATSADGRWVATAREDGAILLTDRRAETSHVLTGHRGSIYALVFATEGALLSGGRDGTVRSWRLDGVFSSRVVPGAFPTTARGTGAVALVGLDGRMRIADAGLRSMRPLGDDVPPVRDSQLSPDGRWLAAVDLGNGVYVWDVESGEHFELVRHDSGLAVAFAPGSALLAIASLDGTLEIWDVATRARRVFERVGEPLRTVAFSPDGSLLASAGTDGVVRVVEVDTGARWAYRGHVAATAPLVFSPSGSLIASADENGEIRLWPTPVDRPRVFRGHEGYVYHPVYSPSGDVLATDGVDATVRLWRTSDGSSVVLRGHSQYVFGVLFTPDGRTIATRSADGTARLWDRRGVCLRVLEGHDGYVRTMAMSADGRTLATGGADGTVRIWGIDDPNRDQVFDAHTGTVTGVAFLTNDSIVSTGDDGVIRQRWLDSGRAITVGEHDQAIDGGMALSTDRTLLATATADGRVWLWHLATRESLELHRHDGEVMALAISPDGRYVASTAEGGAVRVYDRRAGRSRTLTGMDDWVRELAFSPSSDTLATAGQDSTVRLWGLKKGRLVVMRGHQRQAVRGVTFSPDGDLVASTSWDGTARVWANSMEQGAPATARELRTWIEKRTSSDVALYRPE